MTENKPKFSKLVWHKSVRGAGLTPTEYQVLMTIFDYTDASGKNGHPGRKRLAADIGKSEKTISDNIGSLKRKGWLAEVYRGNGVTGNSSTYELRTPSPIGEESRTYEPSPIGAESRSYEDSIGEDSRSHMCEISPSIGEENFTPSDPSYQILGTDPKGSVHQRVEPSWSDLESDQQRLGEKEPEDEPRSSSNDYDPFSQPVEETPAKPELFVPPSPEPAAVEPQRNPDGSPVTTWVETAPKGYDPFGPSPDVQDEHKSFVLEDCQGYTVEETTARLAARFNGSDRAGYRSALLSGYLFNVIDQVHP